MMKFPIVKVLYQLQEIAYPEYFIGYLFVL